MMRCALRGGLLRTPLQARGVLLRGGSERTVSGLDPRTDEHLQVDEIDPRRQMTGRLWPSKSGNQKCPIRPGDRWKSSEPCPLTWAFLSIITSFMIDERRG